MILVLQNRNLLSISKDLRERLGIKPGDPLEASVENGRLVLTPVATVPRPSRLTERGVEKESVAEKEIRRGKIKVFGSAKALVDDLNERRKN